MPGHMEMNKKPSMPNMRGANMNQGQDVKRKAEANMMKASPELAAILVGRLSAMTPEQLDQLDKAITPEAARALMMLLPELRELIQAIQKQGGQAPRREAPRRQAPPPQPQMGALGGMA